MNPHVMLTRSMLTRRFWLMRPAISGLWVLLVLVSDARASKLDDQLTAFRKPNATQTETIVTQILETGIAEHRSAEAMAAVQPWLNRNHLQTQQAMFHAAQAAEFSGSGRLRLDFISACCKSKMLIQKPQVLPSMQPIDFCSTRLAMRLLPTCSCAGMGIAYDRWGRQKDLTGGFSTRQSSVEIWSPCAIGWL